MSDMFARRYRDEVYMSLIDARRHISLAIQALEYPNEMTESVFAPFEDKIDIKGLQDTYNAVDGKIELFGTEITKPELERSE